LDQTGLAHARAPVEADLGRKARCPRFVVPGAVLLPKAFSKIAREADSSWPQKRTREEVLLLTDEHDERHGWGGLWVVDREHSRAEFAVRYLVSETTGVFGEVAGTISFDEENPENSSVEATIDVSSVDTGSQKRDEDLLEREDFLEAESFPEMTFRSTQVEASGSDRMKVTGDLTIRDVTKEVELDVRYRDHSVDGSGTHRANFEAETELSREAFGIDWGGTPGRAAIGDTVTVTLHLEVVRQGFFNV